jgi:hypothetical protein
MYYQKDYLMRLIEDIVRIIAKIFFGKDYKRYEIVDDMLLSQTDLWYRQLMGLVAERRLGEAEDLLHDGIDTNKPDHMSVALDVYLAMNALSDEELEAVDFSREEIQDGLKQACKLFGVPDAALL